MSRLARQIFGLTLGAAVFAAAPLATAQETSRKSVTLSVEQMRNAAALNLRNGHTQRALAFADALLTRDENDLSALLVRSHALRALGKYAPAQAAARSAWQQAETDGQKYSAAMLMAQALSSDGKRTRAQLWLRRAAQTAPTERHAARAARDFKYVRRQNPWQTHLSFTLAPNTNINNGSSQDTSALLYQILNPFDVDGAAEVTLGAASKALSGIEAGLNLQSRYRFHQTERTAHDLRFGMSYRTYKLSQSSKDDLAQEDAERVARGEEARNISGSDYAYGKLQFGYAFKRLREDRRGEFSFSTDVGQTFYGGERYNSFVRARVGQSYYKDANTKYNFGLTGETRRYEGDTRQNLLTFDLGQSKRLANGDGLYLGVVVAAQRGDTARLEYDEIRFRSGYVLGKDVMGTKLQFGLSTSYRDYDVSPHDASGRRDFELSADVTATFKQIDYFGFNPTVSVNASTTNSNIGLYDVNRLGLSIGIASSF